MYSPYPLHEHPITASVDRGTKDLAALKVGVGPGLELVCCLPGRWWSVRPLAARTSALSLAAQQGGLGSCSSVVHVRKAISDTTGCLRKARKEREMRSGPRLPVLSSTSPLRG